MANGDHKKLLRKSEVLVELLGTHASVFVHVDTRVPGVIAPEKLLGQPQVAFQLGNNLAVPVQDLTFHEDGWSATMSFNRVSFKCFFPWKSVYFIVADSGFGATWPIDTPPEVLMKQGKDLDESAPPAPAKRALPKGWRVIEGGGTKASPGGITKPDPEPPKRGYRRPGPRHGPGPFKPSA